MKNISKLPLALQSLFAELKAEQDVQEGIDGTQTQASKEDILDEVVLLKTDVDVYALDDDATDGPPWGWQFACQNRRRRRSAERSGCSGPCARLSPAPGVSDAGRGAEKIFGTHRLR